MILSIDPGISGALAVLNDDGSLHAFAFMPSYKMGKRNRVNGAAVAAFVREYADDITHCYLEKVGAMPGQGVASMFSFGHSAGIVEGIVVGIGIPLTMVTPQAWKKTAGLSGSEKDAARARAVQLFPHVRELDAKGKGQALADALLIGLHGLQK